MKILNFGSLNIDHVYSVERIARPGETLASRAYGVHAGGKGANQSVALARAGAAVAHAGRIGLDGRWLLDKLCGLGVDVGWVRVGPEPTGHAVIQVDAKGQNSIVLFAGANHAIDRTQVDATLESFSTGDILLLQNEISSMTYIMERAHELGLRICLNPAPFTPEVLRYPLDCVAVLMVNETEGMGLARAVSSAGLVQRLAGRWPGATILLTLGERGALYHSAEEEISISAVRVHAVDTTAAGDTFIGYFLAGMAAGQRARESLERAARAAALCVSRPGAMDSIPAAAEVEEARSAATQHPGGP